MVGDFQCSQMPLVVGDSWGYHNNYDILWPYYGSGGGRLSVLSYMALVVVDCQCYHIYGSGGGRLSVLSYMALVVVDSVLSYMALIVVDSVLSYMALVAGDSVLSYVWLWWW